MMLQEKHKEKAECLSIIKADDARKVNNTKGSLRGGMYSNSYIIYGFINYYSGGAVKVMMVF